MRSSRAVMEARTWVGILALAVALGVPRPTEAQQISTSVSAVQRSADLSRPGGYRDDVIGGCTDGRGSTGAPAAVNAATSCAVRGGTIAATAGAAFGGPLRVTGSVSGGLRDQPSGFNSLTLAGSAATWADRLIVGAPPGTAARFSIAARIDGGSLIHDASPFGRSYTQGFLTLTTPGLTGQNLPWGAPSPWGAWANFESDQAVRLSANAAFDGTHTVVGGAGSPFITVTTDGRVTFGNIPLLPGSTPFTLGLQFAAVVWNANTVAQDVPDAASFDYGRTVRFEGITLYDAQGRDVTGAARARLASGATVPGVTTVPEPTTVVLVAGGLVALLGVVRRRRVGRTAAVPG